MDAGGRFNQASVGPEPLSRPAMRFGPSKGTGFDFDSDRLVPPPPDLAGSTRSNLDSLRNGEPRNADPVEAKSARRSQLWGTKYVHALALACRGIKKHTT